MSKDFAKIKKGIVLRPQNGLPASAENGAIFYDSTDEKFKIYQDGAWAEISNDSVSLLGDVTGPTDTTVVEAIQSKPVPVPASANDGQALFYDHALGEFVFDNASGGPGGGFNLESDPYAQAGVGTWTLYNDTTASPVDLTGGTASATFVTASTSTAILDGNYQGVFVLEKPASNVQGNGVAKLYSVAPGVRQQGNLIVRVRVSPSATIDLGDFKLAAYDVTNSKLLPTFGLTDGDIPAVDANDTIRLTVRIPVESTTAQIRLGFHIATNNTTAVDLRFSDLSVGVDSFIDAPIVTEWESYTPTITGGAGSIVSTISGRFRRVGDSAQVQINYVYTSGTGTAANFTLSLPPGLSIDTSKNISNAVLGSGYYFSTSTGFLDTNVRASGTTSVLFSKNGVTNFILGTDADDASAVISAFFDVPILEWSNPNAIISTTEAVNQASFGFVRGHGTTTAAASATSVLDFNGASGGSFVTGGGVVWEASNNRFRIIEPGFYEMSATTRLEHDTLNIPSVLSIRRNGSDLLRAQGIFRAQTTGTNGQTQITAGPTFQKLNKDDLIDCVIINGSSGTLTSISSNVFSALKITRIPDFTTFGVYSEAGQVISSVSAEFDGTGRTSGDFLQMTGNSLTLTPGRWALMPSRCQFLSSGSAGHTRQWAAWYAANGANNATQPAQLSTATGLTVVGSSGATHEGLTDTSFTAASNSVSTASVIVDVTQTVTVYLVARPFATTMANTRTTVAPIAVRLR